MLLEEFDPSKTAVINPSDIYEKVSGMPKIAITCFARTTFERLLNALGGAEIARSSCANAEFPIYKANYQGQDIALFNSDVGAAGCIGVLEDAFMMGVETVIMFGTCGVLDRAIGDCAIIIPDRAMRDEGVSYHYAPASDEIAVNPKYIPEFLEVLHSHRCSYTIGKTWTTDGFYRETPAKVQRRKNQGCVCVDMECSAVAAVAQFRGKEVFQFFYAGDNLDGENWDMRSLSNSSMLVEKDRVAMLAMELALKIGNL